MLSRRWPARLPFELAAGLALVLAVVVGGLLAVNDFQLQVGTLVAIYAISTLGLTVVSGRAGQLALGQAGFMAIGAYTSAYLTREPGLWLPAAIPVAGALATVVGLGVGYVALRLRGNYLAMATLAMGAVIFGLLQIRSPLGGTLGYTRIPGLSLAGRAAAIDQPIWRYAYAWAALAICYAACALLLRRRLGRELAALRDDEVAAAAVGVPVTLRKLQAFAISAFLGGVSGALLAALEGVIDPTLFRPDLSFQLFLMVVLGGLGSLPGAVLGAALVEWLIQIVPGTADYALAALGACVVLLVAVLPGGVAQLVGRGRVLVAGGLRR